jgi:hypothetical protein
MLLKKKRKKNDNKYNIDDNKNVDKFGFIASITSAIKSEGVS